MADKKKATDKSKDKGKNKSDAKAEKGKKGKKGKKGTSTEGVSVAAHPRAGVFVRRAKGYGGLFGFAVALYLSLSAGVPIATAGERALIGGVAGYMVFWACSVTVWRHLVLAELRHHVEQAEARRAEAASNTPTVKA